MTAVDVKVSPSAESESPDVRRKQRLDAFDVEYRRYIRDLSSCSTAVEDLADSFPGLLFALATNYATLAQRDRAFTLVCDGASLREACDVLGLPWWLRKLPAAAFTAPLPNFPTDPEFALRIANLVPREARLVRNWLSRVAYACEACGPAYALWLARQQELSDPVDDTQRQMAAWAWFSQRKETAGHRLLRRPWNPEMSLKRAREELTVWRQRLRLVECLGRGIQKSWLADGTALDYEFVALRTVEDFIAESEALDNCLDQYADQLLAGLTSVFSVRRAGRRLACVEIGPHDEDATMPGIVQLRTARNRRAAPEIWQATYAWIGAQTLTPLSPDRHAPRNTRRSDSRRRLWLPYLAFLAGTPHEQPFRQLVLDQAAVLRRDPHRRPRLLPRLPAAMRGLEPARRG